MADRLATVHIDLFLATAAVDVEYSLSVKTADKRNTILLGAAQRLRQSRTRLRRCVADARRRQCRQADDTYYVERLTTDVHLNKNIVFKGFLFRF